ncbi:MAG: hypothetical protein JSS66_15945 [Armatimonadetes bacterium]|nr:hypothetical protein [Armatimonadota bacterium]
MRTMVFIAAVLTASLALAQDPVALKRNAKEGDSVKYKLAVDTEIGGMAIKFSAKTTDKVMKVNGDGSYVVSSEQQDMVLSINGQDSPAPAGVGGATTTTLSPEGWVADMQGDEVTGDSIRAANLQSFIFPKEPVKVGSKWMSAYKGIKDKGTMDVSYSFEILGQEKVGAHDVFKVSFEAKETAGTDPASSKGTVWVEISTGVVIKSEQQWTNVPIAGQMINGKVVMDIIE